MFAWKKRDYEANWRTNRLLGKELWLHWHGKVHLANSSYLDLGNFELEFYLGILIYNKRKGN